MGTMVTSPYAFLIFTLCGVALGCVYAVYRALRRFGKGKKLLCAIYDIAFWLIALVVLLACLLQATLGVLRFFELAGFLLGFGVCLAGPGAYISRGISVLLHYIKRIGRSINQKMRNSLEKSEDKS